MRAVQQRLRERGGGESYESGSIFWPILANIRRTFINISIDVIKGRGPKRGGEMSAIFG